jgi:protein TonB
MKKFLILILICVAQKTFSQKEIRRVPEPTKDINGNIIPPNEIDIYNPIGIDVKPEFPGGTVEFHQFIDRNYKKSNKRPTLQGKVFATFIIEIDGSLSDIKILRDIGSYSGEELVRVLKLSPRWKPGKLNGKEVRTIYSLVVPVQL